MVSLSALKTEIKKRSIRETLERIVSTSAMLDQGRNNAFNGAGIQNVDSPNWRHP